MRHHWPAMILVAVTGCGIGHGGLDASPTRSAQHPGPAHRSSAAVRDERGHGTVALTEADDGHIVLVDMGQILELSLGDERATWVAPYLVGPRGTNGQDRPLLLQRATGYPSPGPARARALAGNPGNVVLESHRAACGSACDPTMTYDVSVYVNTLPKG
jgi:hypothetical protein